MRALAVLHSRGAFLVMREAFYGTRRFDEFLSALGMSPSTLAARLRELVDDGLLCRESYREAGARSRHEYVLTAKGEALVPALIALLRWANDHLPPSGPPLELVHRGCGARVLAQPVCEHGHEVTRTDLSVAADRA